MPPAASPAQTLCQVAATLIPVVLFGGALAERAVEAATPEGTRSPNRFDLATNLAMLAVITTAVLGELFAVKGIFDPRPVVWEIRFVTGVLALGTTAVGLRASLPWGKRIIDNPGQVYRYYAPASLLALGVAAIFSQFYAFNSVDAALKSVDAATAAQNLSAAESTDATDFETWQSAKTAASSSQVALLALLHGHSFTTLPRKTQKSLAKRIVPFATATAGVEPSPKFMQSEDLRTLKTVRVVHRDFQKNAHGHGFYATRLRAAVTELSVAEKEENSALTELDTACSAAKKDAKNLVPLCRQIPDT